MIRITFKGEEIGPWHGQLVGADGLDASACKVESTDYASMDGAAFGAARMGRREVRLSYALSDEPEEARARIYEVFEPKSKGELGIRTEDKDLVAEAYVGAVECDPWARPQTVEVTLVCPDPWLYARQERQFPYETISTGTGWTGTGWRVSNRGAPAGFVVVGLANEGSVWAGGERIRWSASDTGLVLQLDTREGSRDLYSSSGGRTSYISAITTWAWPQVPHGESIVEGYSSTGDSLRLKERWAGI